MSRYRRREFLGDVGRGMLVASVGFGTAFDMGLTSACADEDSSRERLAFGGLEPLVSLMQETPVRNLVPVLVEKLQAGTEMTELVAGGALAAATRAWRVVNGAGRSPPASRARSMGNPRPGGICTQPGSPPSRARCVPLCGLALVVNRATFSIPPRRWR